MFEVFHVDFQKHSNIFLLKRCMDFGIKRVRLCAGD